MPLRIKIHFWVINLSYDACNEHWYLIIQRISVTRAKTPIISLVRNSHNNSTWEFSLIPCLSCDLVGVIRNYVISKKSFHFVFFSVPARLLKLTFFLFFNALSGVRIWLLRCQFSQLCFNEFPTLVHRYDNFSIKQRVRPS